MNDNPRLSRARGLAILDMWLDEHPLENLLWTVNPDLVEIPFQIPLTDDLVYCGSIDQIGRMKHTGHNVVIDIKTTKSVTPWWVRRWEIDTQISGYTWAAQHHISDVVGVLIGAIEIPEPPKDPGRRCPVHAMPRGKCDLLHARFEWIGPIERTKQQLEDWRFTAIGLAEKYRKLHGKKGWGGLSLSEIPMEGMFSTIGFNNACQGCECRAFCVDGRPIDLMGNYFRYEPWFCIPSLLEEEKDE